MHARNHRAVFQTRLFVAYSHDEEPATTRGRMTGSRILLHPDTRDVPRFLRPGVRPACAQAGRRHPAFLWRTGTHVGDTPCTHPCRTGTAVSISAMPASPPGSPAHRWRPSLEQCARPTSSRAQRPSAPAPTVLYAIETCDPAFGRFHWIRLSRAWTEARTGTVARDPRCVVD